MNNRIFELAKQADLIQWDTLPSGARTPDYESVVKAKKFAESVIRELVSARCTFRVEPSVDGFYYNKFNDYGCITVKFFVDGDPFLMAGEEINAGTHYSTYRLNERFVKHLMKETFGVEE